jgi:transposase
MITAEERQTLRRHKEQSPHKLVIKKADAILLAAQGADTAFIAEFVDRRPVTVQTWLNQWAATRLCSVVTGHSGNLNASKLTQDQRDQVAQVLATPPTDEHGVPVRFWDVPTLANWLSTQFDVVYDSPSSYHFLLRYAGLSFHKPEPFDKRRDENLITSQMAAIRAEITPWLADDEWKVFAADEVRIDQEAETRRAWLPEGRKTVIQVDRQRRAQSWIGFLDQRTGQVELDRLPWQNGKEILAALHRLADRHPNHRICVVWDNAAWHKTKIIREQLNLGGALERVHLIALPPYAPDHNPIEHVWGSAKTAIANIQRDDFNETRTAFERHVTGQTFTFRL